MLNKYILKTVAFLVVFALFNTTIFAQTKTVTGRVVDGSNTQPLHGVTVKLKNSTQSSLTNADGVFTDRKSVV